MTQTKPTTTKFYAILDHDLGFSVYVLIFVLLNINFFHYKIDRSLIEISITMISITYGFFISSVFNMFGRNITVVMMKRQSNIFVGKNKVSQLQKFMYDMKRTVLVEVVLLLVSFSMLLIIGNTSLVFPEYLFKYKDLIQLGFSGVYISLIFFTIISMLRFFNEVIRMMNNEASHMNKEQ